MTNASIGRRFLALCLDALILAIPSGAANHLAPGLGGLMIWFLYAPVLESSAVRGTLGKFLMGIQVVDLQGQQLNLQTATLRSLLKLVSFAILFLGFILALFTERKQALHDLIMGTQVVNGKFEGSVFDAWSARVRAIFNS